MELDSALQRELVAARQMLERPRYRFYERLQRFPDQAFGEAVEYSLATAGMLYGIAGEALGQGGRKLANAYAVYAGGVRGAAALPDGEGAGLIEARIDFSVGKYQLLDQLALEISERLPSVPRPSLAEFGRVAFRWMQDAAQEEARKPEYTELRGKLETLGMRIGNVVIRGFTQQKPEQRYEGSLDAIIGNRELKRKLVGALHNVLRYDPATGRNPVKELYDFPERFFVVGGEGTGKTSTLRALAAEGQRIAGQRSIDFRVRSISNAFKSEYYSASARNLRELFAEIDHGHAAYVVFIEDIDTLFSSRDELRGRGGEDRAVLGEILNRLEGVDSANHGNALLIATTNCPQALDFAFSARLRQCQLIATGPETAMDYVAVLQQKLGSARTTVTLEEWGKLGEYCLQEALSGRAIRNIAMGILESRFGGPKPMEWFSAPPTAHAEPITAAELSTAITAYVAQQQRERDVELQQRIAERKQELRIQLAAMQEVHA